MSLGLHNIHSRAQVRLAFSEDLLTAEEIERFWSKVARRGRNECWLWTASVSGPKRCAHGQFTIRRDGRQLHPKAHRIAWALTQVAIGYIRRGRFIGSGKQAAQVTNPIAAVFELVPHVDLPLRGILDLSLDIPQRKQVAGSFASQSEGGLQ